MSYHCKGCQAEKPDDTVDVVWLCGENDHALMCGDCGRVVGVGWGE